MDEIERDDEDFSMEYLYDEIGPQYVADHAEEITAEFQAAGVTNATIEAHGVHVGAARAQIEKAKNRLRSGDWDEAVFHAARAVEGYLTEVFLVPFRALILEPFRTAFPHLEIRDSALLRTATGLQGSLGFVFVGITATRDAKEAEALVEQLRKLLSKDGNWPIRNPTFHTLNDPTEKQAKDFVAEIDALLERLAAPLDLAATDAAKQAAEAQERAKEARLYKSGGW